MDETGMDEDNWDQAGFWQRKADSSGVFRDPAEPAAKHRLTTGGMPRTRMIVIAAAALVTIGLGVALLPSAPGPSASGITPTSPSSTLEDHLPVPSIASPLTESPTPDPATAAPATTAAALPGATTPPPAPRVTTQAPQPPPPATTAPAPPPPPPPPPSPVSPRNGLVVRIVHPNSGKSIGVSGGSTANSAATVLSGSPGDSAQKWRIVTSPVGCFSLINVKSGKALDNPNGTSVNGTQMHQWTHYADNRNQSWCFTSIGSSRYTIKNGTSGFLLDVRDWGTAAGTPVQQWNADPANPNANQTWQFYTA
jgi:type IV secretory pathway VirB10-like protein